MNLIVTVALVRNLVGLLHSDGAEKSNESIKLAVLFQNTRKIKKLQRLQNYVHSVIFPYITDFIYDEWPEIHHQHSLQSLTILPNTIQQL